MAPPKTDPIKRFFSKVDTSAGQGPWGDCATWKDYKDKDGYGIFWFNGANMRATHFAWQYAHGTPVPPDKLLRHRCDNPSCVLAEHLEIGSQRQNREDCSKRGRTSNQNANKTHCKNGHEFTPENTYLRRSPNGKFRRDCWECKRRRKHEQEA